MTRGLNETGKPVPNDAVSTSPHYLGAIAVGLLAEIDATLGTDVVRARENLRRLDRLFRQLPIWPVHGDSGSEDAVIRPEAGGPGGLAPWQLMRVDAIINQRMDQSLYIEELASHVRLSQSHFCRAFKVSTGQTPHAYIMRQRLERACGLMLESDESLSQIAGACGLADQAHLSRLFRRRFGMTPWQWRRKRRGDPGQGQPPVAA